MLRKIRFKPKAASDIVQFKKFVATECAAPLTARRQFTLLDQHLDWLEQYAELPAVNVGLSIQYGLIIRTIPFGKKMTIVYSIEDEFVYIQRIMPQSMILV